MIEDFMSVLEDYHNANLHSEAARRTIAEALVKHMCDHHMVTYTNLEAAKNDPKMATWIEHCKTKNENQMELPLERGL